MTRVSHGPLLFVSGQTPTTDDGSVPEGAAAQTRVVLDRIRELLGEHGAGWSAVVKVTYFLRDWSRRRCIGAWTRMHWDFQHGGADALGVDQVLLEGWSRDGEVLTAQPVEQFLPGVDHAT